VPVLLFVSGLAASAAGCGAADDDRPAAKAPAAAKTSMPAAPPVDACALLTRAEAEAALGKSTGEPIRSDVAPVFSCSYVTPDRVNNVSVNVMSYGDARQAHDSFQMAVKVNNYEEISGLGDRAYKSVVHDVVVLKGRYEVSLDVTLPLEKDEQIAKARELAGRVLPRLPQ
jgi:hypothetical protein